MKSENKSEDQESDRNHTKAFEIARKARKFVIKAKNDNINDRNE